LVAAKSNDGKFYEMLETDLAEAQRHGQNKKVIHF
jgi:hypothetical protein